MYIGHPPYIERLNDISFWYPILKTIGMRTPETHLIYADKEVGRIVDDVQTDGFKHLVKEIELAQKNFGGEAFLRTGQTSNKHSWEHSCHLKPESKVINHVANLIEFSMMVDLPYTTFAVRKMIETKTITTSFDKMPIAREVRMFAEAGKVICAHPYWPSEAFMGANKIEEIHEKALQTMPDMIELNQMAEYVSARFNGAWSIDFLEDVEGNWWLTDMATAGASYHWPSCQNKDKYQ